MWTKFNPELIKQVNRGSIITEDPDLDNFFEVENIDNGIVKAVHANGKNILKIFNENELITGNWFIKGLF